MQPAKAPNARGQACASQICPWHENAGVMGDALLTVDLIGEDRQSLAVYAWTDPDHRAGYVEWLIPAEFVNSRAVIVSVDVREPATW